MVLISLTDHLEEQLGSGFGEWHISQFIKDQQMEPLQLFVK
jgi:hypothetical protein